MQGSPLPPARPGRPRTESRLLCRARRVLFPLVLFAAFARAASFSPAWSAPVPGTVRSAAVCPRPDSTEELWLLLSDGRLCAAGLADTLRAAGLAPAGATAIAACPDSGLLVFACPRELVARDRAGAVIWRRPLDPPLAADSAWCAGARHLVLWSGGAPHVVQLDAGRAAARRLDCGFVPRWARLADLNGEGTPELVASDGARLSVQYLTGARSLAAAWRAADPAALADQVAGPALFDAADIDSDGAVELTVLTDRSEVAGPDGVPLYDSLRCLAGLTLEQAWCVGADGEALPGKLSAVAAASGRVYVVGTSDRGAWAARIRPDGTVAALRWLEPRGAVHPLTLLPVGTRPAALLRGPGGADALHLLDWTMAGAADPASSGVRFARAAALRLDRDTFPDLLVIGAGPEGELRSAAFINGLGAVLAELEQARAALRTAPRRDIWAARRILQRMNTLREELEPGSTRTADELAHLRRARRTHMAYRGAAVFLVLLGAALLAFSVIHFIRRARSGRRARQVENAPLPVRAALAVDLVALDHNFVSKGNDTGAIERLIEVRERHGLGADRDLGQVADRFEPYYTDTIGRLVAGTPTLPLLSTIERAARAELRARPLEAIELSRPAYLALERREGFRIVLIRNREYPDALRRMRLLSSSGLQAIIEHIVVDHIRYARAHAEVVLEYTVNTQWNRKVFVQFVSDSERAVDFRRRDGHLVSELDELAARLPGVIDVPGPDYEPAEPGEKLWLRITDLVAVLEETRARLRGSGGME